MQPTAELQQVFRQIQQLLQSGAYEKALTFIAQQPAAVKQSNEIKQVTSLLFMKCGKYFDAIDLLGEMVAQDTKAHGLLHNLSEAHRQVNQFEDAKVNAESALNSQPSNEKYALHLSLILKQKGDVSRAIDTLEQFILKYETSDNAKCELASLFVTAYEYERALKVLDSVTLSFYSLMLKLEALISLYRYNDAIDLLPKLDSLKNMANHSEFIGLSEMLVQLGQRETARAYLTQLTDHSFSIIHAKIMNNLLTELEIEQLSSSNWFEQLSANQKQSMLFALSKHYFKLDNTSVAFEYCHEANALSGPDSSYRKGVRHSFKKLEHTIIQRKQVAAYSSDSTVPLFVIGMPRSGTTLIENILSSHSDIAGAGETPYLNLALNEQNFYANTHLERIAYIDDFESWTDEQRKCAVDYYLEHVSQFANSESRVIDKLPHNFMNIAAIVSLFPKSKIIHVRRNPISTCLSIYKENLGEFHSYGYDLNYLVEYYKYYRAHMNRWQSANIADNLYTIDYEQLVDNPEETLRKVFNFIELPFESSCLDFHKEGRAVKTLSKDQVRKPIYRSSLRPWVGIEDQIRPLIEAFATEL